MGFSKAFGSLKCFWFLILAYPSLGVAAPLKTFDNPIIPGFHPDPSICRAGDDFYLVNSTFEYFPGLPIHHSRDLVHWELIGNALDRPSQLPLKGATDFGGNYAPTIRYWKGTFYIVCTNFNGKGSYIISAKDPAGPWSEPQWLGDWLMDGSLFFDDDGKVYYTKHAGGERAGIAQNEIDPGAGKLLTPDKVIYNDKSEPWNEGPHLYKIRGSYFLMLAEGGTGDQHQVVIGRSRSPWGPFEPWPHNPILTHRNFKESPIQATGHGDLVEAQDGSWWMVFLGVRPQGPGGVSLLARETFLAPVAWDQDGWPVVNGNGRVAMEMAAPGLKPYPFKAPAPRQDFGGKPLGPEWIHPRNPDPEDFSLTARKGWLRIHADSGSLSDKDASPAFVGQRQTAFQQRWRARMDFKPGQDGEEAGLCIRSNDSNHYEVGLERKGGHIRLFVRNTVKGDSVTVATAPFAGGPLQLEIACDGPAYAFAWSVDGKHWQRLALSPSADLSKDRAGGYTGVVFGLYASANGKPSRAFVDFDWCELAPGDALDAGPFTPRPTPTPPPAVETWRIHAGGGPYTDRQGGVWAADNCYRGGDTAGSGAAIEGTADAELYQAERWGQDFSYVLPVPPGRYRVTLRFAENYVHGPGQRVFSLALNGRKVLEHFDIFKEAGGPNRALDRRFDGVEPDADGVIRLQFTGETQNAKVGAIQVEKE